MKINRSTLIEHLAAIVILVGVVIVFFFPQYQGQQLRQTDIAQGIAMRGEINEYKEKTGEKYYWNNSMFGGMPDGLLIYGRDYNVLKYTRDITSFFLDKATGNFLRMGLLCYLALIILGLSPWLALLASLALVLNVNHLVLLEAGHNNKIRAMAYFPLIFGGIYLAFNREKLPMKMLGAAIFGAGVSMSIYENHPQMLYYFLLATGVWFAAYVIATGKKVIDRQFGLTVLLLAGAFVLSVGSNMAQIRSTLAMGANTMRGEPILQDDVMQSSSSVKGLDWGYATQWSNSVVDVWSLFIPRVAGGGSGEEMSKDSGIGKYMRMTGSRPDADGTYLAPMYWGKLPSTSGPYYVGAVIFFLFVLSFFVLPAAQRIGFGLAILLAALISLGNNFESFNRFLFDHLPYFNKFRVPSSFLHATSFLFILPAVLAVRAFAQMIHDEVDSKTWFNKKLLPAVIVSSGFCLVFVLLGKSLYDFTALTDGGYPKELQDILVEDRAGIMVSDALRTLGYVLLAAVLLWVYAKGYLKKPWYLFLGLMLISFVDLWQVGRRYIDESNWEKEKEYSEVFAERPVDKQIKNLEPKGRYAYRVLDMSVNTFNNASTSFHHNTIGGYNAAKPQRIMDVIDRLIVRGNQGVLDMMNAKYVINRQGQLQTNPGALGNAWFVKEVKAVNSAEEEINMTGTIDPSSIAVVKLDEFEAVQEKSYSGEGTISLTDYVPGRLVYRVETSAEQFAVFSEAWYPKGWSCTIDGEETPLLRANYMLRALEIPAGNHEIVMTFTPWTGGKAVSLICSLLLLLALIGASYLTYRASSTSEIEASSPMKSSVTPTKSTQGKKHKKTRKK